MTNPDLFLHREGPVAHLVLNRPHARNAITQAMMAAIPQLVAEVAADHTVRVLVVRGVDPTAFAAGADIAEFESERANARQGAQYGARVHEAMQAVAECRHPTIASIRGACIGGGLEIAAMCDLRICGKSSRFGVPINRLGLTMGYGELEGLLAVAGRAVTLEILLEGRVFDAEEAQRKGLVTRVVEDAEVERETGATAERIAGGAPLSARWHKRFVGKLAPRPALSPEEWNEGFACYDTEDYREGVAAFLAKRKPVFKGR